MVEVDTPVLIVGGGLAGLSCGVHLQSELPTIVVDAGCSNTRMSDWDVLADPSTSVDPGLSEFSRAFLAGYADAIEFFSGSLGLTYKRFGSLLRPQEARPGAVALARLRALYVGNGGRILRGTVTQVLYDEERGEINAVRVETRRGATMARGRVILLASGGLSGLMQYSTGIRRRLPNMLALLAGTRMEMANFEKSYFVPFMLHCGSPQRAVSEAEARDLLSVNVRWRLLHGSNSAKSGDDFLRRYLKASLSEPFVVTTPIGVRAVLAPAFHSTIGGFCRTFDGRTSLRNVWALGDCANEPIADGRVKGSALLSMSIFARHVAASITGTLGTAEASRGLCRGTWLSDELVAGEELTRMLWKAFLHRSMGGAATGIDGTFPLGLRKKFLDRISALRRNPGWLKSTPSHAAVRLRKPSVGVIPESRRAKREC